MLKMFVLCVAALSFSELRVDSVMVDSVWNSDSASRVSRDCRVSFIPQGTGWVLAVLSVSSDGGETWWDNDSAFALQGGLVYSVSCGVKQTVIVRVLGGDRGNFVVRVKIRQLNPDNWPAWRKAMTQTNRIYNLSSGSYSEANPLIVFPGGVVPSHFTTNENYAWDLVSGYSSGTLLEDVGELGTLVIGTGGHTRLQTQILSLDLATGLWGWWQQPYFQSDSSNGAEIYYNLAEFAALPSNRIIPGNEDLSGWDRGFPMGYTGWIYPKKLVYGQLGNNNPHGFRYSVPSYIPPHMTGTGAGGYVIVTGPQGPFSQSWAPSGLAASELVDASGLWPSGRRKWPVWVKNTSTGLWSRITGGFEPDYGPYGFVRQHTAVARDQKRVYVSADEGNGTASHWYVDFTNGVAGATVSGFIRPASGDAAPDRNSTGAFTDGHPEGKHLWYWPDLGRSTGLVMQDLDANILYRLDIPSIGADYRGRIGMQYDAANNRILIYKYVGSSFILYKIPIPANHTNAAAYSVTSVTLYVDPGVATPFSFSDDWHGKAKYCAELGVMLIPSMNGKMLAFKPE